MHPIRGVLRHEGCPTGNRPQFPGVEGDGDWFCLGYGAREIAAGKTDAFCDLDNDGDPDLFKVTVEPFIYCYENVGDNRYVDRGRMTSDGKLFILPHDRSNRSWAVLAFDDWDSDDLNDFIACEFENIVWLNRNVGPGGPGKPPVFATTQGIAILKPWTVQMTSGAQATDWNGDGDLDIVTGQGHGGTGLRFFERDYLNDTLRGTHPRVTVGSAEWRSG